MRSQCDRSAVVNPSDFAGKVCRLWFLDEAVGIDLGIFAQGRHEQRQAWRTLRSLPRTCLGGSASQARNSTVGWGFERGRAAIPRRHWPGRDKEPLSRFFLARTMCGLGGSRHSPFRKRTEWFLMTAKCTAIMMAAQ